MNKARHAFDSIEPAHKSPAKRRLVVLGTVATAAAVTAAIVVPRLGSSESSDTVGSVPTIESCGLAHDKASAIGRAACGTALETAQNVVHDQPPKGMRVTGATRAKTTTFGEPTYTFTQKLTSPLGTQEYRISFATTDEGKADLSNIVEEVAANPDHLAIIDHYKQNGKDVYAAGFPDPEAPKQPIVYDTSTAEAVHAMQDSSNSALAAFAAPSVSK